jgi:AcrR family transcriptional regulator
MLSSALVEHLAFSQYAPQTTRRTILECAAKLILETGQKWVDVKALSRKADVQRATIYNCFSETGEVKRVIFQTIVEEFLLHAESTIKTVLGAIDVGAATPMDCLAAVFRATLMAFKNNELFGNVVLQQLNLTNKEESALLAPIFNEVDRMIGEARKADQLNEYAMSLEDWKIRQIMFVTAHGLLRSLYLKEGIRFASRGGPTKKGGFTEREVETQVLRFLQLYCQPAIGARMQARIDALTGRTNATK